MSNYLFTPSGVASYGPVPGDTEVISLQKINALLASIAASGSSGGGGTAGVTSFNTRTGAVTFQAADIASASGTLTSAQLAALVSDETGSGGLVFATSPTLVTPALGVATATSINGIALTNGGSATTFLNGAGGYSTPAGTGVTSFNTRTGAVTLAVADITALGTLANNTTGSAGSVALSTITGAGTGVLAAAANAVNSTGGLTTAAPAYLSVNFNFSGSVGTKKGQLAVTYDGLNFSPLYGLEAYTPPVNAVSGNPNDFRDPGIIGPIKGVYYCCYGATDNTSYFIQICKSVDLATWTYVNQYGSSPIYISPKYFTDPVSGNIYVSCWNGSNTFLLPNTGNDGFTLGSPITLSSITAGAQDPVFVYDAGVYKCFTKNGGNEQPYHLWTSSTLTGTYTDQGQVSALGVWAGNLEGIALFKTPDGLWHAQGGDTFSGYYDSTSPTLTISTWTTPTLMTGYSATGYNWDNGQVVPISPGDILRSTAYYRNFAPTIYSSITNKSSSTTDYIGSAFYNSAGTFKGSAGYADSAVAGATNFRDKIFVNNQVDFVIGNATANHIFARFVYNTGRLVLGQDASDDGSNALQANGSATFVSTTGSPQILIGRDSAVDGNSVALGFNYVSSNSNSNSFTFGIYGKTYGIAQYGSGRGGIWGGTPPSDDGTTGWNVTTGDIKTNGTLIPAGVTASTMAGFDSNKKLVSKTAGTDYPYPTAASANLLAQTAAVASVATTTPAVLGTYNVSAYITVTAVTLDVIQTQVTYTDENGNAQTQTFFPMGLTSAGVSTTGAVSYPPMIIRAGTGAAIVVKTVLTTGTGSITYDVGANIQRLN